MKIMQKILQIKPFLQKNQLITLKITQLSALGPKIALKGSNYGGFPHQKSTITPSRLKSRLNLLLS